MPLPTTQADWLHGLTWLVTGAGREPAFLLSRWLFLRCLGLICLIAFVSFGVQVLGLIGSHGISPVKPYLQAVASMLGPARYERFPTLFWFNADDGALLFACGLGACCSVLLLLGVAPVINLACIWLLYLSLSLAGQEFLSFQWDTLLLETCFLAFLLAPPGLAPGLAAERTVPPLALFLLWWLLFRLMFESGVVKLTCGDPTWRHLTALDFHYFTQPLPTVGGWYAQALPAWFQKLSVVFVLVVEIVLPFLIFVPPPGRYVACGGIALLMVLIAITGNYTFFNLLSLGLCVLLLDDRVWLRILPERLVQALGYAPAGHAVIAHAWGGALIAVAILFLVVGGLQALNACAPQLQTPAEFAARWNVLERVRSLNSYGLFRVMTTQRLEIVVEGSDDGRHWQPYAFRYKPGEPSRPPAWAAPHQPRLDWQMWFAALGAFDDTPWFGNFLVRLLQGSPQVLRLLARNPFPDHPPRFVRAQLYSYRFTTPQERRFTGAWWKREYVGAYAPAMSLRPQKTE